MSESSGSSGSTEPSDSIATFVGDDPAAAAHLRTALRQIADTQPGTPLAGRIEATLSGRSSMRELADDPEFVELTARGARAFAAMWEQLDDEQRAAATEQATRPPSA